jgi:hypothetical protein
MEPIIVVVVVNKEGTTNFHACRGTAMPKMCHLGTSRSHTYYYQRYSIPGHGQTLKQKKNSFFSSQMGNTHSGKPRKSLEKPGFPGFPGKFSPPATINLPFAYHPLPQFNLQTAP